MKIILLIIIKFYWFLIPESKRRKCLFRKSCSRYVYEETKTKGLLVGLKALIFRFKNCKPNYQLIVVAEKKLLITKNNQIFKEEEINKTLLNQK